MNENSIEIAKEYARGWIRRDPQKIADLFNKNGIYIDPLLNRELIQSEIAEHAAHYFALFPDLSFAGVGDFTEKDGLIATRWIMSGTNSVGNKGGKSGFSMEIPGADFIRVETGRILSVHAYFDHRKIPEAIRNGFDQSASSQQSKVTEKYAKSALSIEKRAVIKCEIDRFMNERLLHRECGFGLEALARLVKVSTNHVSQVINTEFGQNFHDYVNGFRIREAKALLVDPARPDQSILDIALQVGFGSKSTFNAVFKKLTNQTPTQFIKANRPRQSGTISRR